jgi:hypothetical protein
MSKFFIGNRGKAISFASLGHSFSEAVFPTLIVLMIFYWNVLLKHDEQYISCIIIMNIFVGLTGIGELPEFHGRTTAICIIIYFIFLGVAIRKIFEMLPKKIIYLLSRYNFSVSFMT